jgi:long-chain acyl-CoA synthetase
VDRLLGAYTIQWRDLLPRLLAYAAYMTFLHKSERTAHEQILFRLESKSRPVVYHDLAQGQTITRAGREVRREMLVAAAALREMGIQPGDRVGIVGLNSSRYLTLDVAIGLAGAVSVPMYYTSPPAEMEAILRASGARLLFIGAPKPLDKVGEFGAGVPVVSFGYAPLPQNLARPVMRWEEFLALGVDKEQSAVAPVDFSAPATLRYTSGTTGQPKGAAFTHANLRWMGEALASLFPWKAKFRTASYLSFLPLNHVVEGILATYSPYYIPAPLDIYYLEDFREIQRALPRVRPKVFFSVPRLYEKVWEGFAQNRVGAFYLRLKEGALKRLLRPLLRWQILNKAGLDRCTQLIAGSAPSSEALLADFRALGIEVHNAYGMTEAPLITLNRLGRNRIGAVGEPLPQTELRIAEDGEVLVRGPQVMKGYFEQGVAQPFQDGWLLTGDLGYVTEEGSLVLQGRKKEMMATAYGKKIYPAKIETMLREIPGVAEAMLVGDSRPYCVALLWVKEECRGEAAAQAIDRSVAETNTRLSHPEQAKRWAILPNDLSIERGDLTANLKLKRQAAMQRFSTVIAALYDGARAPESALHIGAARQE